MKRYRVRKANQNWDAEGPDLLRTRVNSIRAIRGLIQPAQNANWYIRREEAKGFEDWAGPMSKAEAVNKYENWSPSKKKLTFQMGRKNKGGKIEPVIVAQYEAVQDLNIGCSAGAEAIHSLVQHQFPNVKFAGGYVCKQILGSSSWSDHAWHDAVDESFYSANDKGTWWSVRMARSGNMDFDYLLGSREGKVGMSAAPDYGWDPGGPSSHTWHVHYSFRDHDGRNPNCR